MFPFFKRQGPQEVRRSFERNQLRDYGQPPIETAKKRKNPRKHVSTNQWPHGRLNYGFLNRCKEIICRIPHPTAHMKHKGVEYVLSIMPWSRGSYVDIRVHYSVNGQLQPTGQGVLLHLDVISALLPELIGAVRRMENEDTREPEQKAQVSVIRS